MTSSATDKTGALADRVFNAVRGAMETQVMFLGATLGYYRALADSPSLTPAELADTTGTHPRYAREWLEHQAVCGYVEVDDPATPEDQRRYTLPPEHEAVLVDEDSLYFVAPFGQLAAAVGKHSDELLHAYRAGGGVSWATLGHDAREGQAAANRPLFLGPLVPDYLSKIPAVDAALSAGGAVADVGCGLGWSCIGIARGYPNATVHGFDIDEPSLAAARRNAEQYGVSDRVTFFDQLPDAGEYDLVCAFECIHDMSDPVSVLSAMRNMVAPTGTVVVMDERTHEHFTAPADEWEQMLYGFSLLCCLPDGMSHQPSAATGTVMRPATLEQYAKQAGFAGIEVLPLENDFFRFYILRTPNPLHPVAG
ncbi:methyltransferase domain-containing protein [Hoyosella rhizosphaerae]|uniref:SAM-dependent methyltransferase n=1 Tax=Hoyosella rhizosphaerae TaxID=1755582 RepID=A0A916U239_9ACTN|nr:methyltransferase domain-containing protein [Hoyosella rhizosphaerae]MBN4926804.1 methyltransferase domain-containing protein [Hoyosella rhizosphaerae]GGC56328.1 SAM-dependent methyltransferase [Hoyosella rhizosphaerae]